LVDASRQFSHLATQPFILIRQVLPACPERFEFERLSAEIGQLGKCLLVFAGDAVLIGSGLFDSLLQIRNPLVHLRIVGVPLTAQRGQQLSAAGPRQVTIGTQPPSQVRVRGGDNGGLRGRRRGGRGNHIQLDRRHAEAIARRQHGLVKRFAVQEDVAAPTADRQASGFVDDQAVERLNAGLLNP
jgi:hypothetical protein